MAAVLAVAATIPLFIANVGPAKPSGWGLMCAWSIVVAGAAMAYFVVMATNAQADQAVKAQAEAQAELQASIDAHKAAIRRVQSGLRR